MSRYPSAEVEITAELVEHLVTSQFPELAGEPLHYVTHGFDNAIFRLGESHAVRLPRRAMGAALVDHEQSWLPFLADRIALPISAPIHAGVPDHRYPWKWSVVPWIEGHPLGVEPLQLEMCTQLAHALVALHQPAPPTAPRNESRGIPLVGRASITHTLLAELDCADLPATELGQRFDAACATEWSGPPLWVHGDLHPLNVLVDGGRISGIVDFGDLNAGDPATDLLLAFMSMDATERRNFRSLLETLGHPADSEMWDRATGWALSIAAVMAAQDHDSTMRELGVRTLGRILGDPA